ncbi:SMP-30/gluconolactonase/LRE family protein [Pseudonocardia xinjiangensis]|uniref:SMP-30/gluconolactonase/LRE family protein n=1 Tax=Pseudonocardia xinjiangensis TaxID=75289 RepID=UPI003D8B5E6D
MALTLMASTPVAAASTADDVIVLPGATGLEGIAAGAGSTFYAGDTFRGDIFRGDLGRGTAELFIDAPDGRRTNGMATDPQHKLLFVAGGFNGQAYVYDVHTGDTVATYQFAQENVGMVNDVIVTRDGAWFTDMFQPHLYFVPIDRNMVPGAFRTLVVQGPAADTSGQYNLNGIATALNGQDLIVAHSSRGELFMVDARTGTSRKIETVSLPNVDGIEREGRTLWAVQANNLQGGPTNTGQISQLRLEPDGSAVLERVITSDKLQNPTNAARFGHYLAVINGKYDTGYPPTADQYEVVVVRS